MILCLNGNFFNSCPIGFTGVNMIALYKYNQSYNFDLKGHKIATFSDWIQLQAWADCIPKGCRDPKIRFCGKYIDLRKFKDDSYSQTKYNEIYELQRSQS